VDEPRTEARDIVAAVVDEGRFWPTVHAEIALPPELAARARDAAARRARGEPFAYAVGRAAFRFLTLHVDERVLIPRQETEMLVDLVLEARRGRPGGLVADVGTGSGAIALALASEGTFAHVIATDVSSDALEVARYNARHMQGAVRSSVEFRHGADLEPLRGESLDVLVSNPPYIAFSETGELPRSVRDWEPPQALYSGLEGLSVTRALLLGAPDVLCSGGLLALEADSRRAAAVASALRHGSFRDVTLCQDLSGRDRFVLATRT
jgi:release factor glutamine methyltransferase